MSLIWKCGFCNETHTNHGKMRKHEIKCPSNPVNKLCFSCNDYMPGAKNCMKSITTFNVYTSGIECKQWSQKKIS